MDWYSKHVPVDIAKILVGAGMNDDYEGIYVYTTDDSPILFKHKSSMASWYKDRDYIPAPTYGEAVDWLFDRNVFIELIPWKTYALEERIGFSYRISSYNEDLHILEREEWEEYASFRLCMNTAIKRSVEILNESKS